MLINRRDFERLVQQALAEIPDALWERIDNCDVEVRARPTPEQLADGGVEPRGTLLGLYVGHALTHRGLHYDRALPDRIYIFQESIESVCRTDAEIVEQVRTTVLHEIAHHFGIDDDRLNALGMA